MRVSARVESAIHTSSHRDGAVAYPNVGLLLPQVTTRTDMVPPRRDRVLGRRRTVGAVCKSEDVPRTLLSATG